MPMAVAIRSLPGRVAFGLLAALLAVAPLPIASNVAWAKLLLAVGLGAALLLAAAGRLLTGGPRREAPPLLLAAALLWLGAVAWAYLQSRPWLPPSWQHPIWAVAAGQGGLPVTPAVSLAPGATLVALAMMLAYGASFLTAFLLAQSDAAARPLALLLLAITAGYAAWAFVRQAGRLDLPVYPAATMAGAFSSTFVNRNHFAT
jgi:hypothetical protein